MHYPLETSVLTASTRIVWAPIGTPCTLSIYLSIYEIAWIWALSQRLSWYHVHVQLSVPYYDQGRCLTLESWVVYNAITKLDRCVSSKFPVSFNKKTSRLHNYWDKWSRLCIVSVPISEAPSKSCYILFDNLGPTSKVETLKSYLQTPSMFSSFT